MTTIRIALGLTLVAMCAASCSKKAPPTVSPPSAGRVDAARLKAADTEPGQWLTTGRDQGGSYYSPLTDINRDTIKRLGFAWEYQLGTRKGLQATPLVVDGTMYTVGNWGIVYALDAVTGKPLWTYDPKPNPQVARYEQNDVVSKGIVVWHGRVYGVSSDCTLYALDAASGRPAWQVDSLADRSKTHACSGAPQLAGQLVVVGNSGADKSGGGLRGYVSAFDLATGQLRWRFYVVPSLLDKAPPPELVAAAATWDPKRDPQAGGGGTVWDGMGYDPDLDLVYLGTGNAAPYGAPRDATGHGTDNLYTASIVALHGATGRLAWHHQTTPGDRWDYDAAAKLVLADLVVDGAKRATIMQANKNGYFYILDRATGKPVSVTPYAYMNWSTGIDADFRPIIAPGAADYHSQPLLIYPSAAGAHSWPPMAYSPRTGLVYIPAIDAPNFLIDLSRNPGAGIHTQDEVSDNVALVWPDGGYDPAGLAPVFGKLPRAPKASPTDKAIIRSALRAWDPVNKKVVWEQQTSENFLVIDGGALATGGDLVFAGREDGKFVAYDATSGAILKNFDTGTPIMAAPMTYSVNGRQYVAVMAGHGGGFLGSFLNTAAMKYVNDGRVLVFSLDGAADVPKPQVRQDEPYREPPPATASAAQVEQGMKLFMTYCPRCHSFGVPGVTPDLSRLRNGIDNVDVFKAIVLKGAFLSRGMARFDDVLSPADAEAIHAYLVDQSWQTYRRQQKAGATKQ